MSCAGWASRPRRSEWRSSPASRRPKCCTTTAGAVRGVATGNMGVGKDGAPTSNFQPGVELIGKYTLFAEGARGHLGKQVIERFKLLAGRDPQTWGIGIKEVWEVEPARFQAGLVVHSAGLAARQCDLRWRIPLSLRQQPGLDRAASSGLGYSNPYLEPFQEFQRYKTHPTIRAFLDGGKRHRLRRTRDQRERAAEPAQAGLPGRRAARLRRRLPQCAAHQGLARRDQDRHAGRRGRVRRRRGRTQPRRTRRLPAPPSKRAGCTTNCTAHATSSPISTRGWSRGRCCGASTRSCSAARRPGRCTGTRPITRS